MKEGEKRVKSVATFSRFMLVPQTRRSGFPSKFIVDYSGNKGEKGEDLGL